LPLLARDFRACRKKEVMNTLMLLAVLLAQAAPGTKESGWKNVTAGVGGETWGYAGVTLMSAVPDRDEIIAGVSESGL
jgi:hypothetical protein